MKKKVIGITGGIGCGKSAVMSLIEEKYHGAVLLTDQIGHDLMEPGEVNYKAIIEAFGPKIADCEGKINRKMLGALVFDHPDQLKLLNAITHPNILKETNRRIEHLKLNPDIQIICLESALLLDTPLVDFCDEIWYIYADTEVRIQRLIEGRGYTREYCLTVMEKQISEEEFRKKSDVIIDNSSTIDITEKQLDNILKEIYYIQK